MARLTVHTASSLQGTLTVPGDKSISHRALLLSALRKGETLIHDWLDSDDVRRTREALQALGISIQQEGAALRVHGTGREGFRPPKENLYMGNSGTTTRLLLGVLAGCPFRATLTGDESLSQRPMRRVTEPLEEMGARFEGPNGLDKLPLTVQGGNLEGRMYPMLIPSAQVKSAILLAGLAAEGETTVQEIIPTRDHTERMLQYFEKEKGGVIKIAPPFITVKPGLLREGKRELHVPGDFSSAAFFFGAAAIVPGSRITIENVGLNPTRTAFLDVLKRMGADIKVTPNNGIQEWEPTGSVTVSHGELKSVTIKPEEVPILIDELPILMVVATQAHGKTIIQGARELRVKETDRIHSMVDGLFSLKAKIVADGDRIFIEGPNCLQGSVVESFGDHRTAMSLLVAGLAAEGNTTVEGTEWITISFPGFAESLESLRS